MESKQVEYLLVQAYKDDEKGWEDIITEQRLNDLGKEGWSVAHVHWSYEWEQVHITAALMERLLSASKPTDGVEM